MKIKKDGTVSKLKSTLFAQKKFYNKSMFYIFLVSYLIICVIARYIYGNTWFDSFKIVFFIFLVFAILIHTIKEILEKKSEGITSILPYICLVLVLCFPLYKTIQEIGWPIIKIKETAPKFEPNEDKTLFRTYFKDKIIAVDVFYTSYDLNGKHYARMHWIKGVDYDFENNYIQTKHNLHNATGIYVPINGKNVLTDANHIIIYKHRACIFRYYKLFKEQQKENEEFFQNFKRAEN
ncbi:hypothetical protein M0R36_03965 [bacterium]|nr:hypothetical protein [bacterium]